jgi:hypothetical protein
MFFVVLFFNAPVAFIQSLTWLSSISQSLPFVQTVLTNLPDWLNGLVQGFMPSLILLLCYMPLGSVYFIGLEIFKPSHFFVEHCVLCFF